MNKLLIVSSILAIATGIILVAGGVWSISFTQQNVSQEKITTPDDASIPNTKVKGPFTLKSQADVIRKHTLKNTEGATFADMPRQVPKLDDNGDAVLDENGDPVMVPNQARNIWVTATTLTTALHLGIITYLFSSLIILFGLVSIWTGIVFAVLSTKHS